MSWGQGEQRTGTLPPTTECPVAASDRWKRPRDAERDEDQRRTRMGFRSQVLGSGDPPHSPVGPWTSDRRTLTSQSSPLESGARPRSDRKGTDREPRTRRPASLSPSLLGRRKRPGPQRRVSGAERSKRHRKAGPLQAPCCRGDRRRAAGRSVHAPACRAPPEREQLVHHAPLADARERTEASTRPGHREPADARRSPALPLPDNKTFLKMEKTKKNKKLLHRLRGSISESKREGFSARDSPPVTELAPGSLTSGLLQDQTSRRALCGRDEPRPGRSIRLRGKGQGP